jgi:hypothetical protein
MTKERSGETADGHGLDRNNFLPDHAADLPVARSGVSTIQQLINSVRRASRPYAWRGFDDAHAAQWPLPHARHSRLDPLLVSCRVTVTLEADLRARLYLRRRR